MRIKVLGSSSSGNCYLLQGQNETLIIECGINYKDILKGLDFNIRNVVGCLISHEHKDHCKSAKELIKNGITVYTGVQTAQKIGIDDFAINSYKLSFLKSEEVTKVGEFIVLPFRIEHDAAEPLGFLINHREMGSLLFLTDTYYCKYKFNGLTHVLIECNYSSDILKSNLNKGLLSQGMIDRLLRSHFELENAKEFLLKHDLRELKEIILIHLSDGNSNELEFKNYIEGATGKPVYIADEGLEIDLEG